MSYSGVHSPTGQSHIQHIMGGCKKPDTFAVVFPHFIFLFFPLLSFSQAPASHLDQRIHNVFSLWDASLQPARFTPVFSKKNVSARLENDAMEY